MFMAAQTPTFEPQNTNSVIEQKTTSHKLMVVGDHNDLDGLTEVAQEQGWSLTLAPSYKEARIALATVVPDAVVINLNGSNYDNVSFCMTVRSNPAIRDTPMLVLYPESFGKRMKRIASRFRRADAYIEKPLGTTQLFAELNAVILVPRTRLSTVRRRIWFDYVFVLGIAFVYYFLARQICYLFISQ
jgi:DNA-binding response OmpR family regulator